MMGVKQRFFAPIPHDVSLEDLVPRDNLYRRLEEELDLSFVRELVRPLYAKGGRPSVDPVVFFRLQLVMFFEDIRSERELMRVAADRLSVRWFLGYDLHEALPDHSSLTRIRERYGLESFRRFFERIVEECFEAGLVRGKELFFDATKVEANAAVDSLAPRWAVEAHLEGLFEAEEAHPQQEEGEDVPKKGHEITELPTACDDGLRERNAAKSDWISRAGRQDRSFESGYRPRTSDSRASKTDPDATPMTWARSGRAGSATRSTTSWTGVRPGSSSMLWSHPRRSPRTVPCSTSCGAPSSAGASTPARSPATPSTAPARTWRL